MLAQPAPPPKTTLSLKTQPAKNEAPRNLMECYSIYLLTVPIHKVMGSTASMTRGLRKSYDNPPTSMVDNIN